MSLLWTRSGVGRLAARPGSRVASAAATAASARRAATRRDQDRDPVAGQQFGGDVGVAASRRRRGSARSAIAWAPGVRPRRTVPARAPSGWRRQAAYRTAWPSGGDRLLRQREHRRPAVSRASSAARARRPRTTATGSRSRRSAALARAARTPGTSLVRVAANDGQDRVDLAAVRHAPDAPWRARPGWRRRRGRSGWPAGRGRGGRGDRRREPARAAPARSARRPRPRRRPAR